MRERSDYFLKFPVELTECDPPGGFIICTSAESKRIVGGGIIAQGDTLDEAEKEFLRHLEFVCKHHQKRSIELNKWKPFQKGPWSMIGGKWFTIFGIHISFRYGNSMKYGWYIPFTKLNITINNYWLRKPIE